MSDKSEKSDKSERSDLSDWSGSVARSADFMVDKSLAYGSVTKISVCAVCDGC